MTNYKLQVHLTPDDEYKSTPYFWEVSKYVDNRWSNVGCGWSSTITQAYIDAKDYSGGIIDDE